MKSILVQCWLGGNETMNLGEWLIEPILARLGYATRYSPADRREDDEPVLMVIGSDFHRKFLGHQLAELGARPREIHVWGAGNGRGPDFAVGSRADVIVHAVRGPLTAAWNRCPPVPSGDPGFLVPWATGLSRRENSGRVLYVPHWQEREGAEARAAYLGAVDVLDVMMRRHEVRDALKWLAAADFVLTSTLHTAIACIAFGTPWALALPAGRVEPSLPHKWTDVWSLLGGAEPEPVANVAEGRRWWAAAHRTWTLPDPQTLIDAFPHHLAR